MEKVFIDGRIGADAKEYQPKNGGTPFYSFSMVTNKMSNGVQKATWYQVCTRNVSPKMFPYLKKGSMVEVCGGFSVEAEIDQRSGQAVPRITIWADSVEFPQRGKFGSQDNTNGQQQQPNAANVNTPINAMSGAYKPMQDPEPSKFAKTNPVIEQPQTINVQPVVVEKQVSVAAPAYNGPMPSENLSNDLPF